MRTNGSLYWDGLDTFRCVYMGLRLPYNTSDRTFELVDEAGFIDSRFLIEGEAVSGWEYKVHCAEHPVALFGSTVFEFMIKSYTLTLNWDDNKNEAKWNPGLVPCKRTL